jgi:hypothetical protein
MSHHDALLDPGAREAVARGLALAIALVWAVAGVAKLRAREATRDGVARLLGGPAPFVRAVAVGLPVAELGLSLTLAAGWATPAPAMASCALFVTFAVLIARAAIRDTLADGGCGCFGAVRVAGPAAGESAVGWLVARNLILATFALAATGGM